MKLTISELREIIREAWYDHKNGKNRLLHDPAYAKESEYVPDNTKGVLKRWYAKMQPEKERN